MLLHEPHVARPLDQTVGLPPGAARDEPPAETRWWRTGMCGGSGSGGPGTEPGGGPAAMHWRTCGEVGAIRDGR